MFGLHTAGIFKPNDMIFSLFIDIFQNRAIVKARQIEFLLGIGQLIEGLFVRLIERTHFPP
jgi:hypothetical protein